VRASLLAAALWLAPPAVLPLPSRSGAEGPPQPFGVAPGAGADPAPTPHALAAAQDRALISGPFPRGGLVRSLSDGSLLLSDDPGVRAAALQDMRAAGATVVRIPLNWNDAVAAAPGPGFDAVDPADPAYRFQRIDATLRSVAAAALQPLLVIAHAPAFAEAAHRWPYAYPGSWDPSPDALQAFAQAVARRYDGSFPDPAHPWLALPRVRLFQAWNEPNLARYLEPQWVAREGRWSAFSPAAYRALLNAVYAGVKAAQPSATVVAAGVAPDGDRAGVGRMAPVTFLRDLLCLGAAMTRLAAGCGERAHFDVLAFHPLSVQSPDSAAASSLDVSIEDAAKVVRLLRQARRLHSVLPATPKPLWVTELNWESAPQAAGGVAPALQAAWVSRALHRLWIAGVSLVSWEFLVDPLHGVQAWTPTGGIIEYQRPAGLYSAGPQGEVREARPKAFLRGFSLPFDPIRASAGAVRVWALLDAPRESALLERLRGGRWSVLAHLRAGADGVLNDLLRIRGGATLRLLAGARVSAAALLSARAGVA